MRYLHSLNKYRLCLPIVEKMHSPLIFREWEPEDELVERGIFKIKEPAEEKPLIEEPDVLLIPLIGFNE
jgi:5-formyltetrahydrofolate cyclo-ligase